MAKLSEKAKVLLLEETVLTNDLAAVKALFEQHNSFEFTARALGFASRYCGAAMVRTLMENGASFSYTATPAFKTKYDCTVAISNNYSFALNYMNYLFPTYKIKNETHSLISDEERVSVLRVWHEKYDLSEVLYLAILYRDDKIYDELQTLGVTKIPQERKKILSGEHSYTYLNAYERYDRENFQRQIANSSDSSAKTMLERAVSAMEIKKLLLFPGDFYEYDFSKNKFISRYCSPVLFDYFLNQTNMLDRVKKSEVLYALIDEGNAEGLGYALDQKWIEKEKDIDELLLYARNKENPSSSVLAVLMDQQNQTASPLDFDKAFSLMPSAADLKKIWSTKKRESDGTLIITSYKGTETEVTIPAKIGKADVTEIASEAFNPMAPRLTEMQRKARTELCSVTFPETITKIPAGLFAGHSQLKSVTLGENTEEIKKTAFGRTGLENITLPDSVQKIGDCAFQSCSSLKSITLSKNLTSLPYGIFQNTGLETFDVPEHITEIGVYAFSDCEKLKTLTLHENIKKIPSNMVSECPRLRKFKIPASVTEIGSYAFHNTSIKECTIPENVASIGAGAFEDCKALAKIDLPAHTAIGDRAFSGCKLLANDNGEILLNGTFFGFTGDESENAIKPLVLDERIQKIALNRDDMPLITYKAHSEEGQTLDTSALSEGMTVSFGRFPETNDYEMKPLMWRVLAVENDKVLLMTEKEILAVRDEILHRKDHWEISNVRTLLIEGFFHTAFTEKEQSQIENISLKNISCSGKARSNTKDKVFLLSFEEAGQYLPSAESRATKPTEYAHDQQESYKRDWGCWNLRTEGKDGTFISVSDAYGDYATTGSPMFKHYLRPCIWIKK